MYLCGMVRRRDQEGAGFLSNPARRGNNGIRAPTHPAQQVHRLARHHLHAAADLVDEGHHAIDVGIIGKPLLVEVVRGLAGGRGTAVSDGEDTDVVARRDIGPN